MPCSFCNEEGHNVRTCPRVGASQRAALNSLQQQNSPSGTGGLASQSQSCRGAQRPEPAVSSGAQGGAAVLDDESEACLICFEVVPERFRVTLPCCGHVAHLHCLANFCRNMNPAQCYNCESLVPDVRFDDAFRARCRHVNVDPDGVVQQVP